MTGNMNKLRIILLLCVAALMYACDPSVDRQGMGSPILTADELNVSATPVQVNGQNTSNIQLQNNSPILSRWLLDGSVISRKPTDTYNVKRTGVVTIVFEGYNPDGTQVDKELQVSVDVLAE